MMKIFALLLLVSACVTDSAENTTTQAVCGDRPLYPGHTVAFQDGNAVLPRDQWLALQDHMTDLDAYVTCLTDSP